MKVNLTKENRNQVIDIYCKPIKGSITVRYINEETGEVIHSTLYDELLLGENEISINDIEGYEIIDEEKNNNSSEEKSNKEKINDIKDFISLLEEGGKNE